MYEISDEWRAMQQVIKATSAALKACAACMSQLTAASLMAGNAFSAFQPKLSAQTAMLIACNASLAAQLQLTESVRIPDPLPLARPRFLELTPLDDFLCDPRRYANN